jgi:hypothetical protein
MSYNFLEHYKKHRDKDWDYYELCRNPQVSFDMINNFPHIYDTSLSENVNLTWDIIVKNREKHSWFWTRISANKCIDYNIILKNVHEKWDYCGLSINPNITWKIVSLFHDNPWNISELSKHKCITWDIIKSTSDKYYWNPYMVSINPNINMIHILRNPSYGWNFIQYSKNPNASIYHILYFYNTNMIDIETFKKCIFNMSSNPRVSFDTIKNNNLEWDKKQVSLNPSITWDIVLNNPTYNWDRDGLSENPNITWDIIEEYPNGPFNDINYNGNYWNYKILSKNKMGY